MQRPAPVSPVRPSVRRATVLRPAATPEAGVFHWLCLSLKLRFTVVVTATTHQKRGRCCAQLNGSFQRPGARGRKAMILAEFQHHIKKAAPFRNSLRVQFLRLYAGDLFHPALYGGRLQRAFPRKCPPFLRRVLSTNLAGCRAHWHCYGCGPSARQFIAQQMAARMPWCLLAVMATPLALPQIRIPKA